MPRNPMLTQAFRNLQIEEGAIPAVSDGPFSAFTKQFEAFIPRRKLIRRDAFKESGTFVYAGPVGLPSLTLNILPANTTDWFSNVLAYGSEAAVKARSVRLAVMWPAAYPEVLTGQPLSSLQEDYGFYLMSPPAEMQTQFEPNVSVQEGRRTSVANYLGKDMATCSFSGATRGFYLRDIGLTTLFRDQTHAYRNFMEFLTFFLLNGRVVHGSESCVNLQGQALEDKYNRRVHFVAAGPMNAPSLWPVVMERPRSSAWVKLTVGHIDLLGKFKSMRFSQDGPFNFTYSFDMDVVDMGYNARPRNYYSPDLFLGNKKSITQGAENMPFHLVPQQRADCIARDFLVLINGADVGIDVKDPGNFYAGALDKKPLVKTPPLQTTRDRLNDEMDSRQQEFVDNVTPEFRAAVGGTDALKALVKNLFPQIPQTGFAPGSLVAQKMPTENPNYKFVREELFPTVSLNSRLSTYNIDCSLEGSSFNMAFALTDIETFAFMKFQSLPVKLYSEFELWETGRFMVKDKNEASPSDWTTPYYRRFWGVVSSRGLQKTASGSNVLNLRGDSMMWFLKASEFPIGVSVDGAARQVFYGANQSAASKKEPDAEEGRDKGGMMGAESMEGQPAGGGTTETGTSRTKPPLDWATLTLQSFKSANMNVFELIMFALDRSLKYAVLPTGMAVTGELGSSGNAEKGQAEADAYLNRQKANWESERGAISDWWQKRLKTAMSGFRIYGVTDVRQGILVTDPSTNDNQAVGYTTATLDVNYLSLFCPKWADAVNNAFMDQAWMTPHDYIDGLTKTMGMEFYADVDGSIVIKFPFYNLNIFDYAPFTIEAVDIKDWTYEDNMENIKTFVEVRGSVLADGNSSNLGPNAFYIDKRLAETFGLQGVTLEVPFVKNAYAAELFAISYADLANLSAYSMRLTITSRPELRVGFPVYVPHLDIIGYVAAISRSGQVGSNCDMDVTLTALRFRVYDANGNVMSNAIAEETTEAQARQKTQQDQDGDKPPVDSQGRPANSVPPPIGERLKVDSLNTLQTYSNYPYFRGYTIKWVALDGSNLKTANTANEYDQRAPWSKEAKYWSAFRQEAMSSTGKTSINFFPITDAHGFNLVGGMPYGRGLKLTAAGKLIYASSFTLRRPSLKADGNVELDANQKVIEKDVNLEFNTEFLLADFNDLITKASAAPGVKVAVRKKSALTGEPADDLGDRFVSDPVLSVNDNLTVNRSGSIG